MRPVVTDLAWSVYVAYCLCLLLTTMSSAKTDESIEMPFEVRTRVDPRNHVLGVARIPREGAFFRGRPPAMRPLVKML